MAGVKREHVKPKIAELIADDSGVKISKGNDKLGDNIPNVSIMPEETCPGAVAECKFCYAKWCCRYSTSTEVRWSVNTFYAKNNQYRFEMDVSAQIYLARPAYFRIHVGGDFFSQAYLNMWFRICREYSDTKFLAFTKSFTDDCHLDWTEKPDNMIVMWSVFPSSDFTQVPDGPRAYTLFDEIDLFYPPSENERIRNALLCTGKCQRCGVCFNNDINNVDVKFYAHGGNFKKHKHIEVD